MRERVEFNEKLVRKARLWMGSPQKAALSLRHLEWDLKDRSERNSVPGGWNGTCVRMIYCKASPIPSLCNGRRSWGQWYLPATLSLSGPGQSLLVKETHVYLVAEEEEGLLGFPEAVVPDPETDVGVTELLRRCLGHTCLPVTDKGSRQELPQVLLRTTAFSSEPLVTTTSYVSGLSSHVCPHLPVKALLIFSPRVLPIFT